MTRIAEKTVLAWPVVILPVIGAMFWLAGASGSNAATPAQEPLPSHRLETLRKDLQVGNRPVLESFWQEIAKRGTPLIESTPDKSNYRYVTFLWRGQEGTREVFVNTLDQNNQLGDPRFLSQGRMELLPATDVWYKTYRLRDDARFSYRISPNDALTLLPDVKPDDQASRLATFQADPLNPRHYQSRNGDASIAELPNAPPQPWINSLPDVPKGRVVETQIKSTILNNERPIWVYTPPGYKSNGGPYRLLVAFDGATYAAKTDSESVPTSIILDNLLAKGLLPPVVAVMVGNAPGARLKELWYHDPFVEFVAKELMPWVRKHYRVTSDPRKTVIAGLSLGGGASLFAGFRRPEIFGNVISQSGGYMYRQTREEMFLPLKQGQVFYDEDFPEQEWLTRQIAAKPRLPLRVYLEAGLLEDLQWQATPPRSAYPSLILATRHLRDVLQAKGYEIFYNEYNGAHEALSWRGTLADALMKLLGDPKTHAGHATTSAAPSLKRDRGEKH